MNHYHVTFYTLEAITVAANNEKEARTKAVERMFEIYAHLYLTDRENLTDEDIAAVEIDN